MINFVFYYNNLGLFVNFSTRHVWSVQQAKQFKHNLYAETIQLMARKSQLNNFSFYVLPISRNRLQFSENRNISSGIIRQVLFMELTADICFNIYKYTNAMSQIVFSLITLGAKKLQLWLQIYALKQCNISTVFEILQFYGTITF